VDGVTALANGNYVVISRLWNGSRGAATWGDGSTAGPRLFGAVSASNSLVGGATNAGVGAGGVTALANGNYVVDGFQTFTGGSATWGSGTTGISGTVSLLNSLAGRGSISGLSNGNFVLNSSTSNNGAIAAAGLVRVVAPPGGGGFTNPLTFADNAAGATTITPAQITTITNAGTAVTLQANTDITLAVASNILSNNTGGNGGAITMQAGRSILLNSSITSDNGAVTLVANERTANGVVNAQRDPGAAVITMASGTTINAGNANVSLTLNDGAGLGNSTSGNLTLANLTTSGQVLARNLGPTPGSGIAQQLNSVVSAGSLLAVANNGSVVLDNFTLPTSGHLVTTLAGSANGNFRFANGQTLAIDTVGSTSGLTAAGNMVLTASGSLADIDIKATGGITTTAAAATATLSAGRDIVLRGAISAASGSLGLTLNPTGLARTPVSATLMLDGGTGGLTATVNNGKTWQNDGAITMQGASVIRLPNVGGYASFTNAANGVLNVNSTAGWSFTSDPSVQGGIVNNAGTINVNNGTSWEAAFTNTGTGNLNIAAGKAISMQNAQSIAGTANIGAGGTLWVSERHGANAAFNGTTINGTGTLQVVGSGGPVADFTNVNAGAATLLVGSGGTANVLGGTSTFGAVNMTGGTLKGTGTITGNVTNTGGTVAPGASPGILTINGTYVQGPSGALSMEIGGTTAGTLYDQLIVNGDVALGGTLSATFINGFAPAATNSFTLVQSSGTVSGTFATTNVVPAGSTFIPSSSATSVTLAAPPPVTVPPVTVPPVTVPPVTVPPVTVPPVTVPGAEVSLPESQAVLLPQIPATQQIVSALEEPNPVTQDLQQAAIGGVQEEDKPAGLPVCR
ncbi:MAG: hypothetical protein AAB654_01725, partial [Acidobacteriota bacterium]